MRLVAIFALLAYCIALAKASSFRAPDQASIIQLPEVVMLSAESSDHHLFRTPDGSFTPFPNKQKQIQGGV